MEDKVIKALTESWKFLGTALETVSLRLVSKVGGPPGVFQNQEEADAVLKDIPAFCESVVAAFQKEQRVQVAACVSLNDSQMPTGIVLRRPIKPT